MILVDTSVWIDHLRRGNERLVHLLEGEDVLVHPFVTGQLACGSLRNRREILGLLDALPQASVAEHSEVLHLVESNRLMGKGLGYVDVHLIAAALLHNAALWTLDRQLMDVAVRLKAAPESRE